MANTIIQFKRSTVTAIPPDGSLAFGQPAYSTLSEKLFLGNATGTGVDTIGGKLYVDKIAAAASANGSNTLVMRDLTGNIAARVVTADVFVGNVSGLAASAAVLSPGAFINSGGEITGSAVFTGAGNINLALTMGTTGVVAGTYGSASLIPVIIVDSKGRITAASNVAAAGGGGGGNTAYTVSGNTGSNLASGNTNLVFYGGSGITSAITSNTGNTIISHAVDSTVIRTTGGQTITGNLTLSSDLTIGGNLVVNGTWTVINANTLAIGDNIIVLDANLPIGSAPTMNAGVEVNRGNLNSNARVEWDETNDWWTATSNVLVANYSALGRIHTDSYANATAISTGTVAVQYGGTGRSTLTANGVLYGNGTGAIVATSAPTEGLVLQGSAGGVPVFAALDGGSF